MKTWWKEAVGYQIYPRTFYDANGDGIGDLKGITLKLDYLKALGVDLLWIGPFFKSPMDDNGYDVSDYYAVDPIFGTLDDARELIQEAHQRGLRIILDLVLNHTSDEHPWFIEARRNQESEEHSYYIWKKGRINAQGQRIPPTNWSSFFSDSAWCYNEATDEYYMKIFSEKMPDLNWAEPKLRERMMEVARFWLDEGVDGFRVDAVAHLAKDLRFEDSTMPLDAQGNAPDWSKFSNLPALFDYLDELKDQVLRHYDIVTVGEVGGGASPQMALNYANAQTGAFNMVFTFDHCWANGISAGTVSFPEQVKTDVIALKKTFASWYDGLHERAWLPVYWLNHDHPRVVSQYGDPVHYHKPSAKMLCNTLYLMYGTPFMYNGEEIGMTNVDYTELSDFQDVWVKNLYEGVKDQYPLAVLMDHFRRTSRDNARTPMQWSAAPNAGFSTQTPVSKVNGNYRAINVEAQDQDPDSILNHYRAVLKLRKSAEYKPVFIEGEFALLDEDHPDVFAYRRVNSGKTIFVVSNFTGKDTEYTIPARHVRCLLSSYPDSHPQPPKLILRPFESVVLDVLE